MKRKIPSILLLLTIIASAAIFMGCEKDEVKKTYVVTYKVKFTGNLTESVEIKYNDLTAYIDPSTSSEWSTSLQFQSGQSVTLQAMAEDMNSGRVTVTATILYNGTELCSNTDSGNSIALAYTYKLLP